MKIFAICCFLSLAIALSAQAPQAFNYQGIARNAEGVPIINTNISLRITLREGGTPGVEVFREIHNVQTNKLGLFAIEVGRGVPDGGGFANVQWGEHEHFIHIEIDPAGGQNYIPMGSAQLLSVPYALYAGNSNTVGQWEDNTTGINYNQGNVGLGTVQPLYKLDLIGNDDTGEDRYYINLNNHSESNRSLSGIKLSAGPSGHYTSLETVSDTYDWDGDRYNDFGQLYSSGRGLVLRASRNDAVIKFFVGSDDIFAYERMRITASGNVGIGTEDPATKLQVTDGDVFIEDIDKGVIMKSPNGSCWRITVQNDGSLKTTSIVCPN